MKWLLGQSHERPPDYLLTNFSADNLGTQRSIQDWERFAQVRARVQSRPLPRRMVKRHMCGITKMYSSEIVDLSSSHRLPWVLSALMLAILAT